MNRRIVANSYLAQRLALRSGSFSRIYACKPPTAPAAHSGAGGTCDINPCPPGAGCSRRAFRGLDGVLLKRAKSVVHRAASRLAAAHAGIRTLPQASWGLLALTVPSLPGRGFAELGGNPIFVTGFWAWFIAQFLKIFTKRYKKGIWDLKAFLDSGGMPSSHSSLCMGVTTSIAMLYGLGSSLFAVSLCFSLIVMYDAAGVRRHAGHQAEVLNVVVQEIMSGHVVSQRQLKEVLGHTPLQVVCGATLGLMIGAFYPQLAGF